MDSKRAVRNKFWTGVETELPMWLMQVDLQGHSKWVGKLSSWPDALKARRDLQRRLSRRLNQFNFIQSHWSGDGGLYVAPVVGGSAQEVVCAKSALKAANAANDVFLDWKNGEEDRSELGLRISLHKANIWPDNDPGNWFSNELNLFMKYERDLASAGAISMTSEVWRSLPKKSQTGWFPTSVRLGDAVQWMVYWNTTQKEELEQTTFVRWLSHSKYASHGPIAQQIHDSRESAVACGECLVTVAPVSSSGFENKIDLEPVAEAKWADDVPSPSRSRDGHDFAKVCPITIRAPMTDSPKLVIQYVPVWYKWAREFGRKIGQNASERQRYARVALSLDRSDGAIPDILCSHIVVIIDDLKRSKSWILICQRAKTPGQVDFLAGSWSVSIEEQYRPAVNIIGGRTEPQDTTVHASVVRGIREELGIPEEVAPTIETHGLFVEADELRTGILAVARLPVSLEAFRKGFARAVDRAELHAAAVMPLISSNIETLLNSETPPGDFLASKATWIRGKFDSRDNSNKWHTSSKLRLALARWLLDPR